MTPETLSGVHSTVDLARCRVNLRAPGPPVFLVGDSNAAQFSDGVSIAAVSIDSPLTVLTAAGCPLIDVYMRRPGVPASAEAACRRYYESTMRMLLNQKPAKIVIGTSVTHWSDENGVGRTPSDVASIPQARNEALRAGLASTVSRLDEAGHQVVLIRPVHYLYQRSGNDTASSCSPLSWIAGWCAAPVAVSTLDPSQRLARDTVDRVARESGVRELDVTGIQCPRGVCGRTTSTGLPVFMDAGMHISVRFSKSLGPIFATYLS